MTTYLVDCLCVTTIVVVGSWVVFRATVGHSSCGPVGLVSSLLSFVCEVEGCCSDPQDKEQGNFLAAGCGEAKLIPSRYRS